LLFVIRRIYLFAGVRNIFLVDPKLFFSAILSNRRVFKLEGGGCNTPKEIIFFDHLIYSKKALPEGRAKELAMLYILQL
jgi:hypothetical protein